ncbi:MAG: OsmC family protein [Actinomycetota bacterium]|nr:OsmC family protein [Actinomycetota bacterium]
MPDIEVRQRGIERLEISIRDHRLSVAAPTESGDGDVSPMELLVASLGACMELKAAHFLRRSGITGAVTVICEFSMRDDYPDHIESLHFVVKVPEGIPSGRREAVVRVVRTCAVHNPLHLTHHASVSVRDDEGSEHSEDMRDKLLASSHD